MSKSTMKSRERVLTALNHQEPDRIPRDLGGTFTTSIHIDCHSKLKRFLGFEGGADTIDNLQVRTAAIDPRILQRFESDCLPVKTRGPSQWKPQFVTDEKGYERFTDEWGVGRACPPGGYYYDVVSSPLAEATMADLDRFAWPDPKDPGRYEGLESNAKTLYEQTDKCVILSIGTSLFAQIGFLMGWENFFINLATNQPLVRAIVDRLLDFNQTLVGGALDRVGKYVQVFNLYDDLTHHHNLFASKKTLNEIFMPAYKKLLTTVKSKADVKVLFHICGASHLLFEELMSVGVDAFNPIQVSADGMGDTAALKRTFGKRMTFWGGGCDTQRVLSYGTTDEVKQEVRRRISDLAPGGGFVFCAVHNIQSEVPPENIVAMYDEARKWDAYPMRLDEMRKTLET